MKSESTDLDSIEARDCIERDSDAIAKFDVLLGGLDVYDTEEQAFDYQSKLAEFEGDLVLLRASNPRFAGSQTDKHWTVLDVGDEFELHPMTEEADGSEYELHPMTAENEEELMQSTIEARDWVRDWIYSGEMGAVDEFVFQGPYLHLRLGDDAPDLDGSQFTVDDADLSFIVTTPRTGD